MTSILSLHEAGVQLPGAVVLLSPWLDLAQRGPTMRTKATVDPLLLERDLRDCARMYLGVNSPLSPAVDVLAADPRVFPPLLVHVGTDEILLSDAARLADATVSAGGSVELKIWPDLWHVFQMWTPQLPEANEAITQIGNFVRARLGYTPAAR
jgi:acetyl esterase/lipase